MEKYDVRRYLPDVDRVYAESDPKAIKDRQRKALAALQTEGVIRLTPPDDQASRSSSKPHPVSKAAPPTPAFGARGRKPTVRRFLVGFAVAVVAIGTLLFAMGRVLRGRGEALPIASAPQPATALPIASRLPSGAPAATGTAMAPGRQLSPEPEQQRGRKPHRLSSRAPYDQPYGDISDTATPVSSAIPVPLPSSTAPASAGPYPYDRNTPEF